ncbi:MAG: hypothetical protein FOGNACKC_00889 [Anaerolineae bacterium]|nr:hypothetical protein [Anaerolineae bacterium]
MRYANGYLIRVDKHGTHGWQARMPTGEPHKYRSAFFSDARYGGPDEAKRLAREWLAKQERPKPMPYHKGRLLSSNKSGVTSVSVDWCAFIPIGPYDGRKFTKYFSIGTYGEREAKAMAIEFRREWEKAVIKGEAALADFFELYHFSRLERPDNFWSGS